MKRLIIAILASLPLMVAAQTRHNTIVTELAAPAISGARVNVASDCDVTLSTGSLSDKVKGYRVRIYFGNNQNSRHEAYAAQERFRGSFPGISSNVDYTAPYFKVTVGNFLTREEAVMLWGRLLGTFPNAFVVSYQMPVGAFATAGDNIEISSDDVEADD